MDSTTQQTPWTQRPYGPNEMNHLSLPELRERVTEIFAPFDPLRIILFGSHARGQADEESDIDLIIVYDTTKKFLDRLEELYEFWSLPKGVDILAYTPEEFDRMISENSFVQDAVRTGKILYERSRQGSDSLVSAGRG
ncbi:MAG: nucleotidyltransferase domain-containing protein [Deltaproteobacteria bacterium]|nr:nucleotidyltransferase domain-containing protein [Deltaproteobacteria bacterium]